MVQASPRHPVTLLNWAPLVALLLAISGSAMRGTAQGGEARQTESEAGAKRNPSQDISREDRPENAAGIRTALAQLLERDKQAQGKLLAFYLGKEGDFLGHPMGSVSRAYAEQLVFFELARMRHDDKTWDELLQRREWLEEMRGPIGDWNLESQATEQPTVADPLWSTARLVDRIGDLRSGKVSVLGRALREIRIFEQLYLIPDEVERDLDAALVIASKTAQTAQGKEFRLPLLLLLRELGSFSSALDPFLWHCLRSGSPPIQAAALRTGLSRLSDREKADEKGGLTWNAHRLAALRSPDAIVRRAALISQETPLGAHSKEASRALASFAIRSLSDPATRDSQPRLTLACLSVLSQYPYGKENPSPKEWRKLLSPLLKSDHASIRLALTAVVIHRFPEGEPARQIMRQLMRDREWAVRLQAIWKAKELDLGKRDLAWLKPLTTEKSMDLRFFLMARILQASEGSLDAELTSRLLAFAAEELSLAKAGKKNRFTPYLYFMKAAENLSRRDRSLLLLGLKSKNDEWVWAAREALSWHGLLPDSQMKYLRSLLKQSPETDAYLVLPCLYNQALRSGETQEASRHLDQILKEELTASQSPAIYVALEKGTLNDPQKQAIAEILIDEISQGSMDNSRGAWTMLARLGKAWSPWKDVILDYLEIAEDAVQAKEPGWYQDLKLARGLNLLLEALK